MINKVFRLCFFTSLLVVTPIKGFGNWMLCLSDEDSIAHSEKLVYVDSEGSYHLNKKEIRRRGKLIRNRVFAYRDSVIRLKPDSFITENYTKIRYHHKKRNILLLTIPGLYDAMRGEERDYFCESYSTLTITNHETPLKELCHLYVSTIRKNRHALNNIRNFLRPNIYNETVFEDFLLSPFYRFNRRYYRYNYNVDDKNYTKIEFKPRRVNTQLVKGSAWVENQTGKIIKYEIAGMYDMTKFSMKTELGNEGFKSLIAKKCDIDAEIKYLGNRIQVAVTSVNDCDISLPDSVRDRKDWELMNQVRPIPLNEEDKKVIEEHFLIQKILNNKVADSLQTDTIAKPKRNLARHILWDIVGDNLWNKITTNFGNDSKGYLRIGPLFNPLYFGYSNSKGVVYKIKLNANYNFTEKSRIALGFKGGYSFKQRLFYFNIPLQYTFNKKHNGYLLSEIDKSSPITNSSVQNKVKEEFQGNTTIDFEKMDLDYFKNMTYRLLCNYDFNPYIGILGGCVYHRRSAVNPTNFHHLGLRTVYHTLAPLIQIQYRPSGWKGPYFTADYEAGLKGIMGGDAAYGRWEFDASYIHQLSSMRSWSLRAGLGFYSFKGDDHYFLDYSNFQAENLPGGWQDNWSGQFELLQSEWYNASDYYVRVNSTYESPLMLLSWLPIVGKVIEKERIYMSALAVRNYFPYVECGYGFTNNIFSMGIFTGFSSKHFEGFGFKFGLELFEKW